MIRRGLGIDLASSSWAAVGSATLAFDDDRDEFVDVVAGAIHWPQAPLNAHALADAIDRFARREDIRAIAMDGPQGWREDRRCASRKLHQDDGGDVSTVPAVLHRTH